MGKKVDSPWFMINTYVGFKFSEEPQLHKNILNPNQYLLYTILPALKNFENRMGLRLNVGCEDGDDGNDGNFESKTQTNTQKRIQKEREGGCPVGCLMKNPYPTPTKLTDCKVC